MNISLHAQFVNAAKANNLPLVKELSTKVKLHKSGNEAFIESARRGNEEVARWLYSSTTISDAILDSAFRAVGNSIIRNPVDKLNNLYQWLGTELQKRSTQ